MRPPVGSCDRCFAPGRAGNCSLFFCYGKIQNRKSDGGYGMQISTDDKKKQKVSP